MLGINPVRNLATGLMLFEHMQNRQQSHQLQSRAVMSLFGGLFANRISSHGDRIDHEQAFLCALLQQLGKMLVHFYLHDEAEAVDKLILEKNCSENAAALQVLGTTYSRLGIAVAREWGFPEIIIDSMRPLEAPELEANKSPERRLRIVAQFGSGLADALAEPAGARAEAIAVLRERYSKALPISSEQIDELLDTCLGELSDFARLIQFDLEKGPYRDLFERSDDEPPAAEIREHSDSDIAASMEILVEQSDATAATIEKALSDGIQDITDTLTSEFDLNQILHMILETIFRAFGNLRVALCLKDPRSGVFRARFGHGDAIDSLVEHFELKPGAPANVFRVALERNVDLRIDNTRDAGIRGKIPDWYHRHVAARSFTLFPIVVRGTPVGLIYLDSGDRPGLRLSDAQLGLLKTLRNQAILAIRSLS